MFSTLYNSVFPWLGRFFGMLAGFAQSSMMEFLGFLFPSDVYSPSIRCVNLFTGANFSIDSFRPSGAGNWGLSVLLGIRDMINNTVGLLLQSWCELLGIVNLPTWIGLLILFAQFFFGYVMIRWVVSIIKG